MLTTTTAPRTALAAQPSILLTDCRSDQQLYSLWISRFRSAETIRAYEADGQRFHAFCSLPLADLRVDHLRQYLAHLEQQELRPDTVRRRISAVKSLLSFGAKTHFLPINVGTLVKLPARLSNLSERIIPQETAIRASWNDAIGSRNHERNNLRVRLVLTARAFV